MTIIGLNCGYEDYRRKWGVGICLLGFGVYASRHHDGGGVDVSVIAEWPRWKSWEILKWRPMKPVQ